MEKAASVPPVLPELIYVFGPFSAIAKLATDYLWGWLR
jgi:hypothetical protein